MSAAPRALILGIVLTSITVLGRSAPATAERAASPHMRMKLEKSFLKVDVVKVDIWFGPRTRDRLLGLVRGRSYSESIADQVARTALGTGGAVVQMNFLRDISVDQFLDSLRSNLKRSRDAGLISQQTHDLSWRRVNQAFGRLGRRGFDDGDRLRYHADGETLHTIMVSRTGEVVLEVTVRDPDARRTLLAGFFVEGSDFREPLIRSLFARS
jgi:hypothetical protein